MTTKTIRAEGEVGLGTKNIIVVSGDSHIGPRLEQDLRPYCPAEYLEQFDAWAAANTEALEIALKDLSGGTDDPTAGVSTETTAAALRRLFLNMQTAGHYDIHTRLREMDEDGVAAEVIFHGSQNNETLPFVGIRDWAAHDIDVELFGVGYRIYNRWLADFVSVEPERHIGLIYVPMWDVDLAVKEVEWGAEAGLRAVNLPAPRGGVREYDDPAWEPFWSACEGLGLMLATHAGVPQYPTSGPQKMSITRLEVAGWPARRGMHRLIFGGVFERHPGLNLILTEQTRGWWSHTMRELDFVYASPTNELRAQVPKSPSEYMKTNVFYGASFMGPNAVEEAILEGYDTNVIWGRDYPHGEGTYKFPEHEGEQSMTRQCLRWAFADCPKDRTRAMLGDNAIRAYGLDRDALAKVAARIGPTPEEIANPLGEYPDGWHGDVYGQ